jgi:hypothetical protein
MMKSHQPPMHPSWHQRATRAEINEVTAIDKLIVNLRVHQSRQYAHAGLGRPSSRTKEGIAGNGCCA